MAREEVPWEDFCKAFCKMLKVPTYDTQVLDKPSRDLNCLNLKCLRALLSQKPKAPADHAEVVHLENFGAMLNWFGPIAQTGKSNKNVLDSIREILQEP